jgi:hypothetical protein
MSSTYFLGYLIPLKQGRECFENIFEFSEKPSSELTIRHTNIGSDIEKPGKLNAIESQIGSRCIEKSKILENSFLLPDSIKDFLGSFITGSIRDGVIDFLISNKSDLESYSISISLDQRQQFFENEGFFVLQVCLSSFDYKELPVIPKINRLILEITKIFNPYYGFTCVDDIESIIKHYYPNLPTGYGGNVTVIGKQMIYENEFIRINWKSHLDKIYEFHEIDGIFVFFGPDYIGNQNISIIGKSSDLGSWEYIKDEFLEEIRKSYSDSHYEFLKEQIFSKFSPLGQAG